MMPPPAWKTVIEMEHQLSRGFTRTATLCRHVKQLLTRDFDRDAPASHTRILREQTYHPLNRLHMNIAAMGIVVTIVGR